MKILLSVLSGRDSDQQRPTRSHLVSRCHRRLERIPFERNRKRHSNLPFYRISLSIRWKHLIGKTLEADLADADTEETQL